MKKHPLSCALAVTIPFILLSACEGRDYRRSDIGRSAEYSESAYIRGRAQAEKDIRAGRLAIEDYGFPREGQSKYEKLLWRRYRIKLIRVAGDLLDPETLGHAKGYNDVSELEIRRRFGNDVLTKLAAEAAGN